MTRLEIGCAVAGQVAYMIFERWLGRTKRTEANSTIDLIVLMVKSALDKVMPK